MTILHTYGRISADFGSQLEVLEPGGARHRLTLFAHLPERPLVGDRVQFQGERLLEIEPRTNQLTRLQNSGESQALAANLDEVWLCLPLDREPSLGRLTRFSHFARTQGFSPLVILTKLDLCPNPQAWIAPVTALGLEVLLCSVPEGIGVGDLEERLAKGRTALLLGQSGVGKTTLANRLTGNQMATQPVRELDHRGKHVTVTRRLLEVKGGGFLLDIPGLRELAWEEQGQLPEAWEAWAQNCRFSDCRHQEEEGCAIKQAVQDGLLDPDVLAQWQKLEREAAFLARRDDKVASSNSKKRWKQIHKQIRLLQKLEDR